MERVGVSSATLRPECNGKTTHYPWWDRKAKHRIGVINTTGIEPVVEGSNPSYGVKVRCNYDTWAVYVEIDGNSDERSVAQLGRARALGARCRRFESCLSDHPLDCLIRRCYLDSIHTTWSRICKNTTDLRSSSY